MTLPNMMIFVEAISSKQDTIISFGNLNRMD